MAEIILLPTAAAQPVKQHPRRGRLPKAVGKIYQARRRAYKAHMDALEKRTKELNEFRSAAREFMLDAADLVASEESDGMMIFLSRPGEPTTMGVLGSYREDYDSVISAAEELVERMEHYLKGKK